MSKRMLKQKKRSLLRKIFGIFRSKLFIIGFLIFMQLVLLLAVILWLSDYFSYIFLLLTILSTIISIYILQKDENPMYKLTWILVITTLPIFGGLLYLLFGAKKVPRELQKRDLVMRGEQFDVLPQNDTIMKALKEHDPIGYKQANYIWKNANFPIYAYTETKFLKSGEEKFEVMLGELKKAKKFIFLEYFIIAPGVMWQAVLDILKDKVNNGVEVRVLYDDAGCFSTLPSDYVETLLSYGIHAKVFNPIRPRLAMQMNNRDRRKILVIDGLVGFTGGINLADEYINEINRFGHWKDCGVMIKGDAVWNFTLMFLQFWNYDEKIKDDAMLFKPIYPHDQKFTTDGLVQPFADAPTDNENVGENTHINMINNANQYVYCASPYLVIDNEMKVALKLAAKNGVDVRILVPHIPDKKYVFALTQGNYQALIKAGIKIYEYTPGFIHSKTFVSDDKIAIVGTVNMDYRSYYLHYECGVWFYKSSLVKEVKDDYLATLEKSHLVTMEECNSVRWYKKIMRAILNLFAPMM